MIVLYQLKNIKSIIEVSYLEEFFPVVFHDEKIDNPGFPTITRLGFSFSEPVTTASLKMTFMPLADVRCE